MNMINLGVLISCINISSKNFVVVNGGCVDNFFSSDFLVRAERLELSWIAPLAPKASAYTNSATLAMKLPKSAPRLRFGKKLFEVF